MSPDGDRDERILAVIRSLREGEVATYGEIAEDAGFPNRSRLVGRLLALGGNTYGGDTYGGKKQELPWWRVVNAAGRLVPGNELEQIALLKAEGVTCENGRVRVARYGRFSRRRRAPRPAGRPGPGGSAGS